MCACVFDVSKTPLHGCTGTSVQEEQLKCHESKLKQISLEVEEHKRNPPELTPKSKESEEYRIKEHYLTYEVSTSHIFTLNVLMPI